MKKFHIILLLLSPLLLLRCQEYRPQSHEFSNFYGTPAEEIVKAIENNDLEVIKEEVDKNKEILNFRDPKYNLSLLSVAILNHKKKAFEELLKLGADPNIMDGSCGNPFDAAIVYPPSNCDLFFINKLVEYGADPTLRHREKGVEGCNSISNNNAIIDVIKSQRDDMKCGTKMLRALTAKISCPDLNENNNSKDFYQNIIFNCLFVANLKALKFFLMDLACDIPDEIFITNGVIDGIDQGYFSLIEILEDKSYPVINLHHNEEIRQELITFLRK